jgi:hypothetical protein
MLLRHSSGDRQLSGHQSDARRYFSVAPSTNSEGVEIEEEAGWPAACHGNSTAGSDRRVTTTMEDEVLFIRNLP